MMFFDELQVDVGGGFREILGVVVRWKNGFKVVLCQILNYWLNGGSYRVPKSGKRY